MARKIILGVAAVIVLYFAISAYMSYRKETAAAVVYRTDVTVVGGSQKPSAVINLQPGVPHYVVFKTSDLTLNPSVPIMVQAMTIGQEAISPAILIHPQPERNKMVKSKNAFGYSLEYAKIWLPDGSPTGTVWIRP